MRIPAMLATAIVLSLLTHSSTAPAAPETVSTIEQCATLLPKGKRYTFAVYGTIDYTGASPILHGELSLTDDTDGDLTQEGALFARCFAKLVR